MENKPQFRAGAVIAKTALLQQVLAKIFVMKIVSAGKLIDESKLE